MSKSNLRVLPPPAALFEVNIKLLATGQVQVRFPLDQIPLCKQMLTEAGKVIDSAGSENKIILPSGQAVIEK